MRDVSRPGQPAAAAGRSPTTLSNQSASTRWTETSTINSSPRYRSTTSSTKKSGGHLSSRVALKCPPRLSATSHAENSVVAAIAHADVYPHPSDKEQLGNLSSLKGCQCPDSTRSVCRSAYHSNTRLEMPIYSHSSSTSSQSSLESESLLTTSSRGSSRFHEASQVLETGRSFWENSHFAGDKPWNKPQRRRSFLSILWDFKPQTKVEESGDPILVSVHVMGSSGPLRLVVDKKSSVHQTIDFALERYACQRRLPALDDPSPFFGLYCRNPDFEALDGEARIGDQPARQFHLYHKQGKELEAIDKVATVTSRRTKTPASMKNWIWERLSRMKSWAVNMTSYFSDNLTFLATCLNPWRLRWVTFMISANFKALH